MDQLAQKIGSTVEHYVRDTLSLAAKIPGATYLGRYIIKSHQNDPARTLFEILLFLFALRYFFASKQSYSKRDYVQLSDAEVDELISEWEPEPLVNPLNEEEQLYFKEIPTLSSKTDAGYATLEGSDKKLLNLSSVDLYGLSVDPYVKEVGVEKIKNYGLGSCGPAGFYGNEDVHIECEGAMAKLFGAERAILYSHGFNTAPSVIPCFAKRGDVLVVDDAVSMPIQRGLQLSRAKIVFYAHNDMEDLERQLVKCVSGKQPKRLPRRFIVTEGMFEYTGNSPDLVKIVELKHKYKFRIILDESWSLGVLGKTGKGLCEELNVDRRDVDVTIGSLATSLGLYGGYCVGSKAVVEHQRIVSLAYTFSATEPPYLAGCTTAVLNMLGEGAYAKRVHDLRKKAERFNSFLQKCDQIDLISRPDSPIIIFQVNGGNEVNDDDHSVSRLLHRAILKFRENGLLISRLGQVSDWEMFGPVNAVKVFLPESLESSKVKETADLIIKSVKQAIAESDS